MELEGYDLVQNAITLALQIRRKSTAIRSSPSTSRS
jgi:hypothetical protein